MHKASRAITKHMLKESSPNGQQSAVSKLCSSDYCLEVSEYKKGDTAARTRGEEGPSTYSCCPPTTSPIDLISFQGSLTSDRQCESGVDCGREHGLIPTCLSPNKLSCKSV